ncbi:hypothetical protein L1049_027240 [Liquidambar formosana]|uniref:Uncharacterized protein n=1 Tax=Liquidambar formosana TaxID=63359 RepID=A0AAP0R2G7_LIQFO
MPLPLHKLFLSLLIFSLYPLSLLAYPLLIVLSQDDLKDPSSSRDGGPANVVVGGGDSSWWEDDSDAKPDDELDPGSWRPIFEPDSDSSEPKTEEEALYYSGVTKMISAVSSGDPRAMKEAASEIEAAAVGGNPHAQSVLGFLYQTGMMREWNRMKAFMYHCFAADGGNVQSRMALAYDYSRQDATALYKLVAEKGPWSSLSRWALEAYLKGDVGTAFLLYSRMAELGYEVAQSNAAWILDKYGNHSMCMGESGLCTDAERHQREHSLWWQASKQGNEYASLLIRDAYHHGRVPGVLRDYDHAPEVYTQCKSQSNATKGDGCGLIEKV